MAQHIRVVSYDPQWKALYQLEKERIEAVLGPELVEIHHIGSTSVEGLRAKPVIDIMPVVRNIAAVDAHNSDFEALGYECMGEYGIAGRRFFRKGGDERTHHIHIFEESSRGDIERHLAVRDYLRTHGEAAEAYAGLKTRLAELYPYSIDDYCDGKDEFVKALERKALEWYKAAHA